MLSKIQGDILNGDFLYNIDDKFANQSLPTNKYLSKPLQATAARPVNNSANNNVANGRPSINTTGIQMINNHLGVRTNKVPQNMPSFRPRVLPSMDFNVDTAKRNVRPTKPYTSSNAICKTLSPQGFIDPNTQIPVEAVSMNKVQQVKLSWFFSPLEFYVTTAYSDADLDYTSQMKNIHHFYKSATPITKKAAIGSLVIAKFSQNNQLHRARITDFNDNKNQYKAQLIDVGAMAAVDASDVYEMDKIFAKLECQAIKCSLSGVVLRGSLFDMAEKLMDDKKLHCKFMQQKGDTFYVDIVVDGVNVKDKLIRAECLSILSEDIEIERLVGQTVMVQIVSFKDLSSFEIYVCGCETIFEASYRTPNHQPGTKPNDKKLSTGETIPVRIDSLLLGKLGKFFAVTPLIDAFGETTSPICSLSFFSNNFKVVVMHWESCNIAYVQSLSANSFSESMLNELFKFYDIKGDILHEFLPQTLCAVKSANENWYRAQIISETQADVNVRYLDYGNCDYIPKNLVKRLESQFCNTAALAVKVFLPLNDVYSDSETSVYDIVKLTANMQVDLKVLEHFQQNWIVDLLKDGTSLTSVLKAKKGCQAMTVEELKKQIIAIESTQKVAGLQIQQPNSNLKEVMTAVTIVTKETQPVKQPTASSNTQSTTEQTTHQYTSVEIKAPGASTSVVRRYVNDQQFSDGQSDNVPKNGQIEANSDSIVENSNEASNERTVANDIVEEVVEISLNGSNAIDNNLTSIDVLTEADRIQEEHFKIIESAGLGSFPANV